MEDRVALQLSGDFKMKAEQDRAGDHSPADKTISLGLQVYGPDTTEQVHWRGSVWWGQACLCWSGSDR